MNVLFLYDRFGGGHQGQVPKVIEAPPSGWISGVEYKSKLPDDAPKLFGGGGTFVKTADTLYERVYFSHLAPRAEAGGLLPLPEAKDVYYKEFAGFFAPFDLRGPGFHHLTAITMRIVPTMPGPTIRSRGACGASRSKSRKISSAGAIRPTRTSTRSPIALRNGSSSSSDGRTCWS